MLVVDAVCDTFICNDAVITSELTVKFNDDKSFKYMGNKILNNGTKEVPKYQYRIKRKKLITTISPFIFVNSIYVIFFKISEVISNAFLPVALESLWILVAK